MLQMARVSLPDFVKQRELFGIPTSGSVPAVPGQTPFCLGFIKGSARTCAAQFIAWVCHTSGQNLKEIWPELWCSLQVVRVQVHPPTGPEQMLIKSMGWPP